MSKTSKTESGFSCTQCWTSFKKINWDPRKWKTSPQQIAKIAGAILAVCVAALIVSGLMLSYPTAAGAFFSIFSVGGVLSLITFIIASVKAGKNAPIKIDKDTENKFAKVLK